MKPIPRSIRQFLITSCLLMLTAEEISAQWSSNPTVNKTICTAIRDQLLPAIISDGSGGAIITWYDFRTSTSNANIYAQRINASGVVQWTSDGVAICTAANNQVDPAIISDGNGGAIITWRDARAGTFNNDIYAQRIDANGTVQWTSNGVAVCAQTDHQSAPVIVSDGSGGAFISWIDQRNGNDADVYAQRIDAAGALQWTADGVAISTETNEQFVSGIVSDGGGGAIICWSDYRSNNVDIYSQRINSSGTVQWTANGSPVRTALGTQDYTSIISDNSGGAIITWLDNFSGTNDVYAQRINASGTVQWTGSGVAVCTAADNQEVPKIASDGSNGAIITWSDLRSGTEYDLYAQRIDVTGSAQWTANGVVISSAANQQVSPTITPDGSGGAIIAWADNRAGNDDAYAQRISSLGVVQWTSNGVAIATASGAQMSSRIISDGSGGAIIAWEDYRGGATADIYAARVFLDGLLPVELSSFIAVKEKNNIVLKWSTATEVNNYGFEIEKSRTQQSEVGNQNKEEGWVKVGFVEGSGTSNTRKEYSFSDKNLSFGKYYYRLKQIDRDGKFSYSPEVEVTIGTVPTIFALEQNYPNPFNPSTTIGFTLQNSGLTTLKIYDVIGREVATLVNENLDAGVYHQKIFDAARLSSGIYFSRLQNGGKMQLKKMLLMK